ncbi:DUF1667 domain-containing protein [Alkalibacter rhizosphaerae]|nr:DUF1667 domain-containing protein [Alkalibacter rhizosphaerae]
MEKNFTCVVCPIGCSLHVKEEKDGSIDVTGNRCKRGLDYGINEWTDPRRIVTSTIGVVGGLEPVTSVKTVSPIPKGRIMELMDMLNKVMVEAPCSEGMVVLEGIFGEDNDVVVTRDVVKG